MERSLGTNEGRIEKNPRVQKGKERGKERQTRKDKAGFLFLVSCAIGTGLWFNVPW
jgi:hypothetical protein